MVIEDDATGSVETSGIFDPATDGIDFYESLEGVCWLPKPGDMPTGSVPTTVWLALWGSTPSVTVIAAPAPTVGRIVLAARC